MASGLSLESFAAKIGVHRDTLYEWRKRHSEFSDTIKRGTELSLLFWEGLGIDGVQGKIKGFIPAVWIYNMKCRFRGVWVEPTQASIPKERSELEIIMEEALEALNKEAQEKRREPQSEPLLK